jgi:DNA-binding response OmpR family regulator
MASPDNLNNELSMPPTDDSELPLILVVEDNSDMRAYIRDVLQSSFRIEEAFDGEIGVKSARDIGPDLIISDLMMPKMDGFELCKRIKSDQATSHIPIILLTAKAEREDRLEGLELGADDYLIKPFDSRELKIRITNLIEQRLRLRAKFASSIRVEPRDITVSSRDAQFLQKAMNLVEENMDNEAFSVELFSEMIGLSRRQFYQKIKAITGFTPTDFILNMRLKRAAFAIKEKSGTISEIAYSVGFNNLSYFARAFKKQFGTTPSKYGDSKTEFDVD